MPADPIAKEPRFFSPIGKPPSFTEEDYFRLFQEQTNEKWVGEASTAYLTDPASAQLLHEFNPAARIIILLRNPADRAYSLYRWMVQEGYEYAPTFRAALQLEDKRKHQQIPNFWEPEYRYNYLYFTSGLYSEQVGRFLEVFGKEQVLVLQFEALKHSFTTLYTEVCEFLEIQPQALQQEKVNPSVKIRHPYLQFGLRKASDSLVGVLSKWTPRLVQTKRTRDLLLGVGQTSIPAPKLNRQLRRELLQRYEPDIRRLEDLTARDFSQWLER